MARRSCQVTVFVLSLLLASGCQSQPPSTTAPPPVTASRADLKAEEELHARIKADIGDPLCTVDEQCRTLGVGEKACGGPLVWLPYSTTTARGDSLLASAAKLAALQRHRYELTGPSSTCQYAPDPGAHCKSQRCVLRSPGGASY